MKYIKQPKGSSLCGQSCVAMITDMTLDESIEIFGSRGQTNTKQVINALRTRVSITAERLTRVKGPLPELCIVKILWENKGSHWVIHKKGKIYDPAIGVYKLLKYKEMIKKVPGKMTSYIKIE